MNQTPIVFIKRPGNCQTAPFGKFFLKPSTDGRHIFVPVRCKLWSCEICGPIKEEEEIEKLRERIDSVPFRTFIVFTLSHRKVKAKGSVDLIRSIWSNMRKYFARKYGNGTTQFASGIELQASGHAHLNVLINLSEIDPVWLRQSWVSLGGGNNFEMRTITDSRVAGYICKDFRKCSIGNGKKRITYSKKLPPYLGKNPKNGNYNKKIPVEVRRDQIKEGERFKGELITKVHRNKKGAITSFETGYPITKTFPSDMPVWNQ